MMAYVNDHCTDNPLCHDVPYQKNSCLIFNHCPYQYFQQTLLMRNERVYFV